MDFRLLSPNSRAVAAERRKAQANPAAIRFFQNIHHKKKGWVRPVDLKMLLISVLRVNISDQGFKALMSTPLYVSLFGSSGTKRVSLKQLRMKVENSDKASVRIPKQRHSQAAKYSAPSNNVPPRRAHVILKKCLLSSCRKEWYTESIVRTNKNYRKPIAPNEFGKRKNLLDYDLNGNAAGSLRWHNAAGSSSLSAASRVRTSYGLREYKTRDLTVCGTKDVLDWDAVGARNGVKMTAAQAQVQVSDTMRMHFGSITKAFRSVDADKNGSLSPRELRCMLTRLGIQVSDSEFRKFLDKYDDVLQDGKIDFQEFASKFGGRNSLSGIGKGYKSPMRTGTRSGRSCRFSAEQALHLLAKKMKMHFRGVTSAFLAADRNHDGKLTWLELREMLQHWQIMMSDSEYMRLVQKVTASFGTGQRTSCVTLEQFKKSVLGVAVAAGNDPGMLDRHKDYILMHSIRNKKRRARKPDKTSLPGLGDNVERRSHKSSRFGSSKVALPVI